MVSKVLLSFYDYLCFILQIHLKQVFAQKEIWIILNFKFSISLDSRLTLFCHTICREREMLAECEIKQWRGKINEKNEVARNGCLTIQFYSKVTQLDVYHKNSHKKNVCSYKLSKIFAIYKPKMENTLLKFWLSVKKHKKIQSFYFLSFILCIQKLIKKVFICLSNHGVY